MTGGIAADMGAGPPCANHWSLCTRRETSFDRATPGPAPLAGPYSALPGPVSPVMAGQPRRRPNLALINRRPRKGGLARDGTWAGWARGAVLALLLAGGILPLPARAAQLFRLDQRYGTIAFTVSNLGLFRSRGDFTRFMGRLTIDPADPTATRIAVTVAASSVRTPWPQETAMLRSADFFDVAHYPDIRFQSEQVLPAGPGRYMISGAMTLHGRTRPVTLAAQLMHDARDKATGRQIDDFIVTGTLSRRDFDMTADRSFISDRVTIAIHARIILDAPRGG